jgi:hypothetical protein
MKKKIAERLTILITTAFGLVAALAWNDAIRSLFNEGGPLHLFAVYGVWFYALVATILAVVITISFEKVSDKFSK